MLAEWLKPFILYNSDNVSWQICHFPCSHVFVPNINHCMYKADGKVRWFQQKVCYPRHQFNDAPGVLTTHLIISTLLPTTSLEIPHPIKVPACLSGNRDSNIGQTHNGQCPTAKSATVQQEFTTGKGNLPRTIAHLVPAISNLSRFPLLSPGKVIVPLQMITVIAYLPGGVW